MRERDDATAVKAYAWTLPGFTEADESLPIRQSAASLGMNLQLFDGRAFWPLRDPEHWPLCPSTPQLNGFRLLKSALYRLAADDGCQAVVNGHYGDRLYPHYHHVLADALADRRLAEFLRELEFVLRRSGALGLHRHPAVRRVAKRALGRRDVWRLSADALTPDARRLMQGLADWPPEADEHPRPDHYRALLGAEVAKGVNGEQFFTAQFGLDWVEPYIDWDLVDFVLSVPAYAFWNRGETKVLMRRAMRGRIPEAVRTAPRTGLLGEFFHDGMDRSMAWIKRRLAGREVDWPRFVERRVVERICESRDRNDRDRLLVLACVAYEMWLDRYFR
jgi:asparagine synthase (glutamine-hydrolysing)